MNRFLAVLSKDNSSTNRPRRRRAAGALSLAAALVTLLAGQGTPLYAGCCEEGTKELLAESINDYSMSFPIQNDLPACKTTTNSMFEEFGDAGGWSRTRRSNNFAREKDWKKSSLPGGADNVIADAKDFGYFCGHGNEGFVLFSTDQTDKFLQPEDTAFGDVDLEWVTFDSSKTLHSFTLDKWHNNAFKGGLHMLLGWHDSPLDGDTGGEFADDLIDWDWGLLDGGGDSILVSWFASDGGCTDQDSGTAQNVIAENFIVALDHLHGQGQVAKDPVFDSLAIILKHDC
jgi:hypothetical protein